MSVRLNHDTPSKVISHWAAKAEDRAKMREFTLFLETVKRFTTRKYEHCWTPPFELPPPLYGVGCYHIRED